MSLEGRPFYFMVGRTLKYTVEELTAKVNEYFETQERQTLAGLALFLGIDRQTLYNYRERDEFFDIIKESVNRVEAKYEERLIYENAPTGVIFALKNMGWKDKSEVEQSGGLTINWKEERTYETK